MPLPAKHPGQSKQAFIESCMSSKVMNEDFPDKAQRAAVCFRQYGEKRAKAAYVVQAGDDEILYTKSTIYLSEALIEKAKTLPPSGPGYLNVRARYKSGNVYAGRVNNCESFETDDDAIEDEESEMLDIEMND